MQESLQKVILKYKKVPFGDLVLYLDNPDDAYIPIKNASQTYYHYSFQIFPKKALQNNQRTAG